MTIEWRRVTWYSQAVATILFVAIFAWGFYLGKKQAETRSFLVPQAIVSLTPSIQTTTVPAGWVTYHSLSSPKFDISYPRTWYQNFSPEWEMDGPWEFATVPLTEYVHGLGTPPSGHVWLSIAHGICNSPHDQFIKEEVGPNNTSYWEKRVCINNFQLSATYWGGEGKYRGQEENILNTILESFKVE